MYRNIKLYTKVVDIMFHVKHEFSTDYLCCIKSNYLNLLFTVVLFLDFNIMIDK